MKVKVRVQPKTSRNEIISQFDGTLKVFLTVSPVEGKANEALVKIIAKEYNVAKSRVRIVQGLKSRDKIVEIDKL